MDRLAYLAAMALLGIGLTMAQNPKASSDPSNSSNSSAQAQSTSGAGATEQTPRAMPRHHRTAADSENTPRTTAQDEQNSTTSTTEVSGQSVTQPSTSTGSISATPDSPHTALTPGPAARAAATHTPDPGTCMNPVALETGQNGGETNPASPCR